MIDVHFKQVLFLDIETVPEFSDFNLLTDEKQELWDKKTAYLRKDADVKEFYERAGIWAEFGKIICISVGYFSLLEEDNRNFRVTSFYGDEVKILQDFINLLTNHFNKSNHLLCAHNGKEFDFPYIARRIIINGLPLPKKLQFFGKKPWEIPHLDTMDLWKFGDYKHFTSLKLLTNILGIQSPKDDIDGSDVGKVFYQENNIKRIVAYCERDVIAVVQVLLKFTGRPLLEHSEVTRV